MPGFRPAGGLQPGLRPVDDPVLAGHLDRRLLGVPQSGSLLTSRPFLPPARLSVSFVTGHVGDVSKVVRRRPLTASTLAADLDVDLALRSRTMSGSCCRTTRRYTRPLSGSSSSGLVASRLPMIEPGGQCEAAKCDPGADGVDVFAVELLALRQGDRDAAGVGFAGAAVNVAWIAGCPRRWTRRSASGRASGRRGGRRSWRPGTALLDCETPPSEPCAVLCTANGSQFVALMMKFGRSIFSSSDLSRSGIPRGSAGAGRRRRRPGR